jgi:hypothetical protein
MTKKFYVITVQAWAWTCIIKHFTVLISQSVCYYQSLPPLPTSVEPLTGFYSKGRLLVLYANVREKGKIRTNTLAYNETVKIKIL